MEVGGLRFYGGFTANMSIETADKSPKAAAGHYQISAMP